MKISVITVCRNAKDCIEGAIASVVSQTYTNIEYIVIDGASDDGTPDIVKNYDDNGRITKLISEPDGGVYEAMNKGIRLASGDYLFFLNSDDAFIDETVVQDVVTVLKQNPQCDFLYGDLLFQLTRNGETYSQLVTFPTPEGLPDHLISDCLLHQASFSRRNLFDKLGYFNEVYRIGSDYEWFLRLISDSSLTFHYYPRTVVSYNAGGMSSDMSKTLAEMFEIQNEAPFYQTDYWLKRRVAKFQDILRDPKGRFGLSRVTEPQRVPQTQDLYVVQLETKIGQLQAKIRKLREQKKQLKKQLSESSRLISQNGSDGHHSTSSRLSKLRTGLSLFREGLGL